MVRQVSSAMNAAVLSVALRTQIGLKRFHHGVEGKRNLVVLNNPFAFKVKRFTDEKVAQPLAA